MLPHKEKLLWNQNGIDFEAKAGPDETPPAAKRKERLKHSGSGGEPKRMSLAALSHTMKQRRTKKHP